MFLSSVFFKMQVIAYILSEWFHLKIKLALLGQFYADFKWIPQDVLQFHFFFLR